MKPVEPVELLAERLGIDRERIAKLDGNENPYGPSPRALEALSSYRDYNIYPDPDQRRLRAALSKHLGVPPEYIVAGSGSDELIQLLVSVFLRPGDTVIDLVPTFGMYSFEADVAGGQTVQVKRRQDFSVDVNAVAEAIDARTRLIFATSPNNPTGNLLSLDELEGLVDLGLPVVVDEAYIEFARERSFVSLVPDRPNLIVMRTFSKWAGLAGLRIGYAAMAPELAECLFRIKAAVQRERCRRSRGVGVAGGHRGPDGARAGDRVRTGETLPHPAGDSIPTTHSISGELHPMQRPGRRRAPDSRQAA